MYILTRALVKPIERGSNWVEADLSGVLCSDFFRTYRDIWVELTHPILEGSHCVQLTQFKNELGLYVNTFTQWLTDIGNRSLPTTPGTLSVKRGVVRSADAVECGYFVTGGDKTKHRDTELSPNEQVDVLVDHPNIDPVKLGKNCLFTVNGIVHQASFGSEGLYLIDGGKSANRAKRTEVGIINFQDIGELECHQIKKEWFTKPVELLGYKDRIYLKLPFDTTGKTLLVVLNGFLHVLDESYSRPGKNLLLINTNRLPFFEQYYMTDELTEHEELGLTVTEGDVRVTAELTSDETIKRLFTNSRSFVVVLDGTDITTDRGALETTGVVGRYTYHKYPVGLITGPYGSLPEASVRQEQGGILICVSPHNYARKRMNDTFNAAKRLCQQNAVYGAEGNPLFHAELLEIYEERVIVKA